MQYVGGFAVIDIDHIESWVKSTEEGWVNEQIRGGPCMYVPTETILQLCAEIRKMKRCKICKHFRIGDGGDSYCLELTYFIDGDAYYYRPKERCDKWEIST
jgi:hypothetical protein